MRVPLCKFIRKLSNKAKNVRSRRITSWPSKQKRWKSKLIFSQTPRKNKRQLKMRQPRRKKRMKSEPKD